MVTSGSVRTARCAAVFFVMSFIGETRGRELESISQRPEPAPRRVSLEVSN